MKRLAMAFAVVLASTGTALAERPAAGAKAPDFTLPATDGTAFHLAAANAKRTVVVAFFPKAFTGG